MRLSLLLVENPQRELWLQKTLSPVLKDQRRVEVATAALMDADPSRTKAYVLWLASLTLNGTISINGAVAQKENTQIRLPEDAPRVQETLATYDRAKQRLPPEFRDLTRLKDFYSVEDAVAKVIDTGAVAANSARARQVPGAEIVYNQAPYTIYKVAKINTKRGWNDQTPLPPDEQTRVQAVEALGAGPPETKWCTRRGYRGDQSMASSYLSQFDMFVVYKDGKPFIQKGGKYCLDVNDRPIRMPQELVEGYFDPEAANVRRAMEEKVAKMLKAGANGPPGVISNRGTAIDCWKIIDPNPEDVNSYYYLIIGHGRQEKHKTSQKWANKKILPLFVAAGVVEAGPRRPLWPEGKPENYDYDETGRYVRLANPIMRPDSSTAQDLVLKCDKILTINKVNVAAFTGGLRPESQETLTNAAPNQMAAPAQKRSFLQRLRGV